MDCEEVKILSIAHILGDLEPNSEQYRQLESHLASCRFCTEEYKSSKWAIEFIEQHKTIFAEVLRTPEEKKAAEQEEIERSWKCIEAKRDELDVQERQEKQIRSRRLLVRISTAAACLVIGVFVWLVFSHYSKPNTLSRTLSSERVTSALNPSVKVELVGQSGNIVIPTGQKIVSGHELKTLLINGKHRMMINTNTLLSIEPLIENSNIGCLVKLDFGQIYTHVEHDGNPFIVETPNGKATITGTTFNIKAECDKTTLIVAVGTVNFSSEKGLVKVRSGQLSKIIAKAAPATPTICDIRRLTAWVTGFKRESELLVAKSLPPDIYKLESPWPIEKEPVAIDEIDFNYWITINRGWFETQFPWIFQLQDALAREGIEVDYPELLIKSGDLWKFAYITQRERFSIFSFDSLLQTASFYGFDKKWLLENVSAAKYALEKPASPNVAFNSVKAFQQWNIAFEDKQQSQDGLGYDSLISLLHASIYVINTKSLTWFAANKGQYDLLDKERIKVLALLQKQVNAASICAENALHQPCKEKQLCDIEISKQDEWYQWADMLSKNIKEIVSVEEKMAEYEIGK